jgi:colicin import membrane protein
MDGALWSLYQRQAPRFQLTRGMMASILAHVLVAVTALAVSGLQPRRNLQTPYYAVDLVSLDQAGLKDGGSIGGAARKSAATGPQQAKAHQSIPVMPVERLRSQTLAEPVAPLKKFDARTDVDKTVSSSTPDLDKKMDKLIAKPKPVAELPSAPAKAPSTDSKTAVAGSAEAEANANAAKATEGKGSEAGAGKDRDAKQGATAGAGQKGGSSEGTGAGPSGASSLALGLYTSEAKRIIENGWVFDKSRLKGQHLEATIILLVRRDGKILNYRFEKKSGNTLVDESAERAVRKVDSLPPFPKIYSPSQLEISISFRPEELG